MKEDCDVLKGDLLKTQIYLSRRALFRRQRNGSYQIGLDF